MPTLTMGVGVYIPNWNCVYKSDGMGRSGLPDGWSAPSAYPTGLNEGLWWESLQRGDYRIGGAVTTDTPSASLDWWGRCIRMQVPASTSGNTNRYILTPLTRAGDLFEGDQMGSGPTSGYWYYGHSLLVRALSSSDYVSSGVTLTLTVSLIVYNKAMTAQKTMTMYSGNVSYLVGASWTTISAPTPVALDNTGWTGTGSNTPYYMQMKIAIPTNTSSGTSKPIDFLVTNPVIYTLGPIDQAATLSGVLDGESLLSSIPDVKYSFSREPVWSGTRFSQISHMTRTQGKFGVSRMRDISNGVKTMRIDLPVRYWRYADMQKLYKLWSANVGYASTPNSPWGKPLTLAMQCNWFDTPGLLYVNMLGEDFPLTYDGDFLGSEKPTANLFSGVISVEVT